MPVPTLDIDKRLIFTVTSGRSGTLYLTELLKAIPGVSAHHEPSPDFTQAMRRIQTDPFIAYPFWLQMKLPEILKVPEAVYVETSHLFCKGFLEPLLRMGVRPALVFLRRPRGTWPGASCYARPSRGAPPPAPSICWTPAI